MASTYLKQYSSLIDFDQKSLASMFMFTYVTSTLCWLTAELGVFLSWMDNRI